MEIDNVIAKSFTVSYILTREMGKPNKSVLLVARADEDIVEIIQQRINPPPIIHQNEDADLLYQIINGDISLSKIADIIAFMRQTDKIDEKERLEDDKISNT